LVRAKETYFDRAHWQERPSHVGMIRNSLPAQAVVLQLCCSMLKVSWAFGGWMEMVRSLGEMSPWSVSERCPCPCLLRDRQPSPFCGADPRTMSPLYMRRCDASIVQVLATQALCDAASPTTWFRTRVLKYHTIWFRWHLHICWVCA